MPVDLISLAIIALVAAACPILAKLIPGKLIPETVFLLIAGAVLGPNLVGAIELTDSVGLLSDLGLAFLFTFTGTSLQNTFVLMILCNIVHYFSTPYLMMKNSLSKLNAGWETTALLMGDSWPKTILRVVTPNAAASLIEVFSYYFINAMVTISALIFLAGARTMVLTTKIKQLQYVNKYNEVFVLSLLILFTNLLAKAIFTWLANRSEKKTNANK